MDNSLKVQSQIRENAEEVSSYLRELSKWESSARSKYESFQTKKQNSSKKSVYTYSGESECTVPYNENEILAPSANHAESSNLKLLNSASLTPATIVGNVVINNKVSVPKARNFVSNDDPEIIERERGNAEYQKGDFQAAIRCYTRCIGLKLNNYTAFSNRAMALLKVKEYHRAETDCTYALNIEPNHLKSLQRRASARNAIGKHRAALRDLNRALEIEPNNKLVRNDVNKTRELLRTAVSRAPFVLLFNESGEAQLPCDTFDAVAGPDPLRTS